MTIRSPKLKPHIETLYRNKLTAAGRFDMTGIPPSFDKIVIEILRLRTDQASTIDFCHLLFNGDTTAANYKSTVTRTGSDSGNNAEDAQNINDGPFTPFVPGASATANYFAIGEISIPNYADSKFKVAQCQTLYRATANEQAWSTGVVHWESTDAINQITLQPDGYATDEFIADSEIVLYGVTY